MVIISVQCNLYSSALMGRLAREVELTLPAHNQVIWATWLPTPVRFCMHPDLSAQLQRKSMASYDGDTNL